MKKIIITILVFFSLFSATSSNAIPNYYDSFDGTGNITWQVRIGTFTIENQRYRAESDVGSSKLALATTGITMTEGSIQAVIQTKDMSSMYEDAFILFGYQDNNSFYMIGARDGANKWTLEKITNGSKAEFTRFSETISSGIDYTIKATFENGAVTLFVNGIQKFTYSFGTIPQGEIGLAVNNAISYFDDVEIYSAGAPVQIPKKIRFQGRLKDSSGLDIDAPLGIAVTFNIYNTPTGGTPLWSVQQNAVIEEGKLDVVLDLTDATNLSFNEPYYLAVKVETDEEMTPRFEMTTVPYAFTSEK